MESQRSLLFIGLILVSFLLWTEWNKDYGPQPVPVATPQVETGVPGNDLPTDTNTQGDVPVSAEASLTPVASAQGPSTINITTDTLSLQIDLRGGDVISADLEQFPVEQGGEEAFSLLRPQRDNLYIAQSGLVGRDGTDNATGRPVFTSTQASYTLNGEQLVVPLTTVKGDLQVTKSFVFTQGSHAVDVIYDIKNLSSENKQVMFYGQLKQSMNGSGGSMFMPTYRGSAYSTQEDIYEKHDFDDSVDEPLSISTKAGWVAMIEHYFVTAWVPNQTQTNVLYSKASGSYALTGFTGEATDIAPGEQKQIKSVLYMGPKNQEVLKGIAEHLDLTIDYGFLWMISKLLFWLLTAIQSVVINWGVAIICITIVVKGSMYFLTKKQYESMAKLRALQPKMQKLKERYGEDRQKMSQGMMELYKKEKVNPMGGCLPLLLQMPIFLALYWVFLESVELRHADFALWINDLSAPDPFYVLPALTGLSMYLLQKLQPMTGTDPMQQKIMQWMPVAMSVFFFFFPAGLVLYWLVSNIITLVQAKIIYASMDKKGIKR